MNFFGPHIPPPGGEPLFHLLVPHGSTLPVTRSCRGCGLTLSALRNSSTVGCQLCYESFQDVLLSVLQQLHGATHHSGKVPSKSEQKLRQQVEAFQAQLQEAVSQERYEEAAVLRDRIANLRRDLGDD